VSGKVLLGARVEGAEKPVMMAEAEVADVRAVARVEKRMMMVVVVVVVVRLCVEFLFWCGVVSMW
jgi:hypothetical protein